MPTGAILYHFSDCPFLCMIEEVTQLWMHQIKYTSWAAQESNVRVLSLLQGIPEIIEDEIVSVPDAKYTKGEFEVSRCISATLFSYSILYVNCLKINIAEIAFRRCYPLQITSPILSNFPASMQLQYTHEVFCREKRKYMHPIGLQTKRL